MSNLYRASFGGGGGELHGAEIEVIINESSFASKPVELYKNGEKVDTKVFPSSGERKATFIIQEVGTYWILSNDGRLQAEEYVIINSEEIVNKTKKTILLTVGFNYREWISRGGVEETYSSLADVLADQKTVRQLMTVHDSADYMIESLATDTDLKSTLLSSDYALKWIGLRDYTYDHMPSDFIASWLASDKWEYALKDHVPIMTSNTAPYGEVKSSTISDSGYDAYFVFDNNSGTKSASSSNYGSKYWEYVFTNPICVKKVSIEAATRCGSFKIQYSNDGITYNDLSSSLVYNPSPKNSDPGESLGVKTYEVNTSNIYATRLRCVMLSGASVDGGSYSYVYTIQFYGRSLNVSVPKMDTDTTPYGVVSCSSVYSTTYEAVKAFNGNYENGNGWLPSDTDTIGNAYVQYEFTRPIVPKMALAYMTASNVGSNVNIVYAVLGINDGEDPEPLGTIELKSYIVWYHLNIEQYKSYKMIRFLRSGGTSGIAAGNGINFQIYGVDYTERDFAESFQMKYLYDHGVEPSGDLTMISNDGGIFNRNSNNLYFEKTTQTIKLIVGKLVEFSTHNYKVIRATVYDRLYSSNAGGRFYIYECNSEGNGTSYSYLEVSKDNQASLNVENIHEDKYATIANWSTSNHTGYANISELWLE